MAIYRCPPLLQRRRTFRDTHALTHAKAARRTGASCTLGIVASPQTQCGLQPQMCWPKSDSTVRLRGLNSTGSLRFTMIRDRRRVDRRITDTWTDGSGRSRALSILHTPDMQRSLDSTHSPSQTLHIKRNNLFAENDATSVMKTDLP